MTEIGHATAGSPPDGSNSQMNRRGFLYAVCAAYLAMVKSARAEWTSCLPTAFEVSGGVPEGLDTSTTLWYDRPAKNWFEALPIGNGRLGAMISGGAERDELWLNEETLYSEVPETYNLPLNIEPEFEKVVGLLESERYAEAEEIVRRHWLGRAQPCYQPLGKLTFEFGGASPAQEYRRELTLSDAVHRVSFQRDGVRITRETFASASDDVIVCRIHADHPGALNVTARFDSPHENSHQQSDADELILAGQLPGFVLRRTLEYVEQAGDQWKYPEIWNKDGSRKPIAAQILYGEPVGNRGLEFEARLRVLACDGQFSSTDDELVVTKASELVVAVTMASNFEGFDTKPTSQGLARSRTSRAMRRIRGLDCKTLQAHHTMDYKRLFEAVELQLLPHPSAGANANLPTDKRRLQEAATDTALSVLYFNYSRYLLIASSRKGTQPANLQGIWNQDRIPPWACGYTTNINVEMNYWGAYPTGLGECEYPLFDLIRECTVTGSRVARDMYHRPGWVLHHNTSIWREAQPVDGTGYISFWPMGAGWLCQHLWEHYRFSQDIAFLRTDAYPIMKGAAEFFDAWLIEDGNGQLVTPVSDSPENPFSYTDPDGKKRIAGLTMGCTLDIAILRELFSNVVAAADLLTIDRNFRDHIKDRLQKLPPYKIGSRGQLLEFNREFGEPSQRHNSSPIYPLFPGSEITLRKTPRLASAMRTLLEERPKKGGEWPCALFACAWARLGASETAYGYLSSMYLSTHPNLLNGSGEVFQIDGNLGGMAATVEMLVQSQTGELELLPALPVAWPSGRLSGFRARGGLIISMSWHDGRLTEATLKAVHPIDSSVRYGDRTAPLKLSRNQSMRFNGELKAHR